LTDRLAVLSRAREGLGAAVLSRARERLGAAVLSRARERLRGTHRQKYRRPSAHDWQPKFRIVHVAGILKGGNFS